VFVDHIADCGGAVRIIACIEDPVVIQKIPTHLKKKATPEPEPVALSAGAACLRAGMHRKASRPVWLTPLVQLRLLSSWALC